MIDIGLPDADGRDLCPALRASGVGAPILFLTARDALTDWLSGFSTGGDDYVTKPFDIEEAVARLQALLRRAAPARAPTSSGGGLALDPSQLVVSRDGCTQTLAPTEFRLLAALAGRTSCERRSPTSPPTPSSRSATRRSATTAAVRFNR